VLGYVVAWFVLDEGEIANIAVDPNERGKGFGSALLDAALAVAGHRAVRTVYLEVRASNHQARALYDSRGFTEVGRRKAYYRRPVEDAVVLRRILDEPAAEGRRER
jgi:ribosomal-protein-alanine N-acetyltransferase